MRKILPLPLVLSLLFLVVVGVFLTTFIWAWAVRRPTSSAASAEANIAAPSATPAEPKPITFAAIGASDVVGVGAEDPITQSWASVLFERMPEGTRFVRLGRNGITLHEAIQLEVPQAVQAKPDIVTIWNCVNDVTHGVTLTSYLDDLTTALSSLTQNTEAHVLLLNMPDLTVVAGSAIDRQQRELMQGGIRQWNKAMADLAASYDGRVIIVDLFNLSGEILEHPEYISPDHFHPSSTGYRRLADVVWSNIQAEHLLDRQGLNYGK